MLFRRRLTVQALVVFAVCAVLIVVFNAYFLHLHSKTQRLTGQDRVVKGQHLRADRLPDPSPSSPIHGRPRWEPSLAERIEDRWRSLNLPSVADQGSSDPTSSRGRSPPALNASAEAVWKLARSWVGSRQVYPSLRKNPKLAPYLLGVLGAMATLPVTGAAVGTGGTQLKMTLTLKGEQRAVFKPMRYSRDAVFTDTPYAGADRHNGEIVAFHLSRLLDFRWVPLAIGRKVNLRSEILPVAEKALKDTFFEQGNDTCFYGSCYYCKREDPACGQGPMLEGAVILWLPQHLKLRMHRHPWRRLYKQGAVAPWEVNDAFCDRVRGNRLYGDGSRLLDLIDICVFDFLIGNADRHRYEVFHAFNDSMVILLDNGKSFGNPHRDELTILAPLYQCCQIRRSTFETLSNLPEGPLSSSLLRLSSQDPLHPLLTKDHFGALDRRWLKVLNVIEFCLEEHTDSKVLF